MSSGFTKEERAAMRERAKELKAEAARASGEADLLAKIAEMGPGDKALAEGVHRLVKAHAPSLSPKTWYGMPAYSGEDGKVVCFFQSAGKFGSRYATLGFTDSSGLDEGAMWPTSFGLTEIGPTEETAIAALLRRAVG